LCHAWRSLGTCKVDELGKLLDFTVSDARDLGIGLRDHGAFDWRFDGDATSLGISEDQLKAVKSVESFKGKYGDEFTRRGCVMLRRGKKLASVDCEAKLDWICEGTLENTLSKSEGIVATKDLKADEGAFCLWNLEEPVDYLPNDEGTNFRNTDLRVLCRRVAANVSFAPTIQLPGGVVV